MKVVFRHFAGFVAIITIIIGFFALLEISVRCFWNQPATDSNRDSAPPKQIFAHPNGRDDAFDIQPDPVLGYRMVRQTPKEAFVDSNGVHFSRKKPDGVFRIICLGGSTTYGIGADSIKYSYPGDLQRFFDAGFADCPRKIEVINAGEMGYHSWHSLLRVKLELGELSPDLYLVMDGLNDVAEIQRIKNIDELRKEEDILRGLASFKPTASDRLRKILGATNSLCEHLAFYQLLRHVISSVQAKATPEDRDKDFTLKMHAFGYARNMEALAKAARDQGAQTVIVNYPWIVAPKIDWKEQLKRLPFPASRGVVELYARGRTYVGAANHKLTASNDVGLADPQVLFDSLADQGEPIQRIYCSDLIHFTNRGNYLLARSVYESLLTDPALKAFLGECLPASLRDIDNLPLSQFLMGWGRGLVQYSMDDALKLPRFPQHIAPSMAKIANSDFNDWVVFTPEDLRSQEPTIISVTLSDSVEQGLFFFPRLAHLGDEVRVTVAGPNGAADKELFTWNKNIEDGIWSPFGAAYALSPDVLLPSGVILTIRLTGNAQVYGKNGDIFFKAP